MKNYLLSFISTKNSNELNHLKNLNMQHNEEKVAIIFQREGDNQPTWIGPSPVTESLTEPNRWKTTASLIRKIMNYEAEDTGSQTKIIFLLIMSKITSTSIITNNLNLLEIKDQLCPFGIEILSLEQAAQ